MRPSLALLLLTLGATSICSADAIVNDASFETPVIINSYIYDPTGSAWNFVGNAGIASNTFFEGTPPDGSQTAFLQADGGGSFSQDISGLIVGDTYFFTFWTAERDSVRPADEFDVSLGLNDLGSFTPTSTVFGEQSTGSVVATATTMTLSFTGQSGNGEADSAIDLVQIVDTSASAAPEPGTLLLLVSALGGIFFIMRRENRATR